MTDPNTSYQILVVDDEESIRSLLSRRLARAGYECMGAASGEEALEIVEGGGHSFDLALVDINMPGMKGIELLRRMQQRDDALSVIILTAYADTETAVEALRYGAYDFLNKPIEFEKLKLTAANGIERTRLLRENRAYTVELEERVAQRTAELAARNERITRYFLQTTMALVTAIEAKDKYTEGHSRRVADFGRLIALELGIAGIAVDRLYVAGLLHDVGKIGVPDQVLLKNGRLEPDEWVVMRSHSEKSAEIISHIDDMADVVNVVRAHHEWWNGAGYPDGLRSEAIPLGARILHVADAFDAMTTTRPYRGGRSLADAHREIVTCRGEQFDPVVADAFDRLVVAGKITLGVP